jgi:hypothetical protein
MNIKALACLAGLLLLQACGNGSSNPQSSVPPAKTFVNWSTVQRITIGDSSYSAIAAQATGSVVFYTDNYNGLSVVDVANLEQINVYKKVVDPEVSDGVGHSSFDVMYNLSVFGNIASVAVIPGCIGWCSPGSGEIRLYDIGDRSRATYLTTITGPLSPEFLLMEGNYLFASGTNNLTLTNQFVVIDISDPMHPRQIGAVDISGPGPLAKAGTRVLVSQVQVDVSDADNYKNIEAIDVSNPLAPVQLGPPSTTTSFNMRYSPIVISGKVAYLSDWSNGLYVVDITDTLAPSQVTKIAQPDTIHAMASYGNYLYLACGTGGLRIYDIKTPQYPVLVNTIATSTSIRFVSVTSGRGVYITDSAPDSLSGQQLNVFFVDETK